MIRSISTVFLCLLGVNAVAQSPQSVQVQLPVQSKQPPVSVPAPVQYQTVQVPVSQPVTYQTVQVQQPVQTVQYQTVQVQQPVTYQTVQTYAAPVQTMSTTTQSGQRTYQLGPGPFSMVMSHVGQRMVAMGGKTHTWTVNHSVTRAVPSQPAPPVTYQTVQVQQAPVQYQTVQVPVSQPVQYQTVAQPSAQHAPQAPQTNPINAPSENAPPPPVAPK